MEPKVSLACSQEPTTNPYPGLDASSPHLPTLYFLNIYSSMHQSLIHTYEV
jgi:hypothetical protein